MHCVTPQQTQGCSVSSRALLCFAGQLAIRYAETALRFLGQAATYAAEAVKQDRQGITMHDVTDIKSAWHKIIMTVWQAPGSLGMDQVGASGINALAMPDALHRSRSSCGAYLAARTRSLQTSLTNASSALHTAVQHWLKYQQMLQVANCRGAKINPQQKSRVDRLWPLRLANFAKAAGLCLESLNIQPPPLQFEVQSPPPAAEVTAAADNSDTGSDICKPQGKGVGVQRGVAHTGNHAAGHVPSNMQCADRDISVRGTDQPTKLSTMAATERAITNAQGDRMTNGLLKAPSRSYERQLTALQLGWHKNHRRWPSF
eukprot:jgi/Chrzof1/10305/Cz04g36190.t1